MKIGKSRGKRHGNHGRRFFRGLATLTLVLCLPGLCLAAHAEGRLTCQGAVQGYLFAADGKQPVTHLFGSSPAIMAGEVLTDELLIRELPEGTYALYLKCLLPDGADSLFRRFSLEIRDSWDRQGFGGTLDKLTGWQFLGSFRQEDALLKLTLTVPEDLSPRCQENWTRLQWQMLAEEKLPEGEFSVIPQTGDETALLPAAGAACFSALGLLLLRKRKRIGGLCKLPNYL